MPYSDRELALALRALLFSQPRTSTRVARSEPTPPAVEPLGADLLYTIERERGAKTERARRAKSAATRARRATV